jgi:hypothetical protein
VRQLDVLCNIPNTQSRYLGARREIAGTLNKIPAAARAVADMMSIRGTSSARRAGVQRETGPPATVLRRAALPGGAHRPMAQPPAAGPATDSDVPEGHRALHSTLYDKDASQVHADGGAYRPVEGQDDGSALLPVAEYVAARDGAKPPGVFAVYNTARELQYVGFRYAACGLGGSGRGPQPASRPAPRRSWRRHASEVGWLHPMPAASLTDAWTTHKCAAATLCCQSRRCRRAWAPSAWRTCGRLLSPTR